MYRSDKQCNWLTAAGAAVLMTTGSALTQHAWANGGGGGGGEFGTGTHQHLDLGFQHNRYYYDRGYAVRTPPEGGIANLMGSTGEQYYFSRGNCYRWRGDWYRCWGGAWVVVDAPAGLFVPALPPYSTTIWRSGTRYDYANEAYYVWDSGRAAYEVMPAP